MGPYLGAIWNRTLVFLDERSVTPVLKADYNRGGNSWQSDLPNGRMACLIRYQATKFQPTTTAKT